MRKRLFVVLISLILITSGLSSAATWDVTDNELSGETFDPPGNQAGGLVFSEDGTRAIIAGDSNQAVYSVELSDPWNISTATVVDTKTYNNDIYDISTANGGREVYVLTGDDQGQTDGETIIHYQVTTSYTFADGSAQADTYPVDNDINLAGNGGLWVNESGDVMAANAGGSLHVYTLSTPYDVSTASLDTTNSISGDGININPTGEYLYTAGDGSSTVRKYNLSTPYDPGGTLTLNQSQNVGITSSGGVFYKRDGSKFWVSEQGGEIHTFSSFAQTISGNVVAHNGTGIGGVTVSINSSTVTDTTSPDGSYSIPADDGTHIITASRDGYTDNATTVEVSGSDVSGANITLFREADLEIDIRGFMEHGETQRYAVIANESGTHNDVTDQANVSSSNTTVVSVDESGNELIATSDVSVNDVATITAEYQGKQVTKDVTVANQTIGNIGIMPSPQWIPSIIGVGEEGTWIGGIGSEFQWLIILIIIVYGLTFVTNSASVGVGVGVGGTIALWVAGYVSVGMLLSILLFGAFITLTTLDLQNDQTVVHEYR